MRYEYTATFTSDDNRPLPDQDITFSFSHDSEETMRVRRSVACAALRKVLPLCEGLDARTIIDLLICHRVRPDLLNAGLFLESEAKLLEAEEKTDE